MRGLRGFRFPGLPYSLFESLTPLMIPRTTKQMGTLIILTLLDGLGFRVYKGHMRSILRGTFRGTTLGETLNPKPFTPKPSTLNLKP